MVVSLMKSLCFSFIVLTSFATLFSVADARRFYVGDNGAWVVNPRESYNTWAERNRFQVNDTLYFKYAKGSDSVQRVMKADYDGCNVRNPLEKFDNGESEFTLNRSGPFYFISGKQENCMKGQKLIVVVLAIRHNPKVPVAPAKAPSTAQPPKVSPPAKAPSTTQPPKSNTPVSPVAPAKAPSTAETPKAHSPVSPPAKAPSTAETPKAHSPVSPTSPAKAPSTSQPPKSSVSPSHAPTMSPATHFPPSKSPSPSTSSPKSSPSSSPSSPKSPSPASSPSSSTPSPAKPPSSSPTPPDDSPATPAPEKTPPSSPTPSGSTPADNIKAPAPSPRNAASGVAVTSVLTTVLSVAFTVLIFA